MHIRSLLMISAASLLAAGAATAQSSTKTVPNGTTVFDSNESSEFPFVYDASRMQQIWDGAQIATTGAVITAMAYRRDLETQGTLQGRAIANLQIAFGHSSNTPATMRPTFTNNVSGNLTTVFQGTLNLPTAPHTQIHQAWGVKIPFSGPFTYQRSNGHLLMDFQIPGQAQRKASYPLDAVVAGGPGRARSFGTTGSFGVPATSSTRADARSATPGGTIDFIVTLSAPTAYPTLMMVGASATLLGGGGLLPIDLAVIGAPGNTLYIDPAVAVPVSLTSSGSRHTGSLRVPLPNDPSLSAKNVYAQSVFRLATANALGLVFDNAARVTIGGGLPAPTQILGQSDSSASTGFFWFGNSATGGPVVELTGAFN